MAAYDEGVDEPLAWMLFLGSSSMLMGNMLSCTAQRSTRLAPFMLQGNSQDQCQTES